MRMLYLFIHDALNIIIAVSVIMLGSNREDDLLSKLKNCIGSLKTEAQPYQEPKNSIPAYNTIKENYRTPTIPNTSALLPQNTTKNSTYISHHYQDRQPLAASNHALPTASYIPHNYQHPQPPYRPELPLASNRYEPEPRLKTRNDDYRSYDTTPKKF